MTLEDQMYGIESRILIQCQVQARKVPMRQTHCLDTPPTPTPNPTPTPGQFRNSQAPGPCDPVPGSDLSRASVATDSRTRTQTRSLRGCAEQLGDLAAFSGRVLFFLLFLSSWSRFSSPEGNPNPFWGSTLERFFQASWGRGQPLQA